MASNRIIAVLLAGCALAALHDPCDLAAPPQPEPEDPCTTVKPGLNAAEIVGIAVGSVAGAAAIAGGIVGGVAASHRKDGTSPPPQVAARTGQHRKSPPLTSTSTSTSLPLLPCIVYTACPQNQTCQAGTICMDGEVLPVIPVVIPVLVPGGNRLWEAHDKPVVAQTDMAAKVGSSSVLMGVSSFVLFGFAFLAISGFLYAKRNMNRSTSPITVHEYSLVQDLEEDIE